MWLLAARRGQMGSHHRVCRSRMEQVLCLSLNRKEICGWPILEVSTREASGVDASRGREILVLVTAPMAALCG